VRTRTSTAGNRGFTLLELLVVLFIIGLVASVVSFSAGRFRDKMIFNDEARRIFQGLKHSRESAILERREIFFRVDEQSNTYWIDIGDNKTSEKHILPAGLTLAGRDIYFSPKGSSSGGKIEIRNEKGKKYEIEVSKVLGTPQLKRL